MWVPKTVDDLHNMVREQLHETTHLEFKRHLPEPGKNDDLAKDICAFANTEGGAIVYGVEEHEGRAKSLSPFSLSGAAERVSLVAQNSLDGPLTRASITAIPSGTEDNGGYLVVEVARSERAPHFVQGTAWGRTARGNTRLTRRRIGELFARSVGFAEEFGLLVGRPGRVFVKTGAEQRVGSTTKDYFLVFVNDGDSEVNDADWEWDITETSLASLNVLNNPFPIQSFPAGLSVRVRVTRTMGTSDYLVVKTSWHDKSGITRGQEWPITW